MSEAAPPTLIRQLRNTPMRDLVRGRVTGRLDVKRRIATSELPEPVKSLIQRIVRISRLWKLEKLDIADDLIAHFRDGLESGATPAELINSFGDERRAAKLIRRAKKRNRPLPWHILRAFVWILVALVALYLGLAAYFFAGRPTPTINYVDQLNEKTKRASPEQLAWPLYQKVIAQLSGTEPNHREMIVYPGGEPDLIDQTPSGPRWPELVAYLDAHSDVLKLIRQAAAKPVLGFNLATGDWPKGLPGPLPPRSVRPSDKIPPLIFVLLPHLNEMRTIARLAAADARLARERGDAHQFMRDCTAINGISDQLRADFLVTNLVSLGIREVLLNEVESAVTEKPEQLSDTNLQQLAHRLSVPQTAADLISFDGERLMLHDSIQRMYTDDGKGDGRITPEGIEYLTWASSIWNGEHPDAMVALSGPAALVAGASRREMRAEADHMMDVADAQLNQPIRESKASPVEQQLLEWSHSPTDRLKYALLLTLMPRVDSTRFISDRYLGHRDGVITGIALELYRRHSGRYPDTLQQLTPTLLPSVPVDRITGDPVRYRLINGRPIVYSVGADRDDDGGRPAIDRQGNPNPAQWAQPTSGNPDGDWILYPQSATPTQASTTRGK